MASEQNYSAGIDSGGATENQTLSVWALTALVVGSMVGAGIFTLPGRFGRATAATTLSAWNPEWLWPMAAIPPPIPLCGKKGWK
jgi:arginine:ornithine antiporter / lysine permease